MRFVGRDATMLELWRALRDEFRNWIMSAARSCGPNLTLPKLLSHSTA